MSACNSGSLATGQPAERKLSYYAVLYLDLMGQKNAIAELEDLKLLADNPEEYYHCFGVAAGRVWGVRQFLEDRLRGEVGAVRASAGYAAPHATIQMFADTVMAYFRYRPDNPNSIVTLYSLLVATAETMIHGLASEIPIRGGLDIHAATELNAADIAGPHAPTSPVIHGGDIWGPAPKRAYELAEKDHNYMRVRVGQGVPGLVTESTRWISQQLETDPHKAPWFVPPLEAAKKAFRMVARDPVDEHPIVDYLGKATGELMAPEAIALVDKAVAFGKSAYERSRTNPDCGVTDKYGKLMRYIAARQEPNGIVPALAGK